MKLKDTFQKHKTAIIGAGFIAALIGLVLLFAYLSAPSDISTPKADQHDRNAVVLEQEATKAEGNANVYRAQRVENEKETTVAKSRLTTQKKQYEKVRTTPVVVDSSDLDARERKLQSDLANLYPANR